MFKILTHPVVQQCLAESCENSEPAPPSWLVISSRGPPALPHLAYVPRDDAPLSLPPPPFSVKLHSAYVIMWHIYDVQIPGAIAGIMPIIYLSKQQKKCTLRGEEEWRSGKLHNKGEVLLLFRNIPKIQSLLWMAEQCLAQLSCVLGTGWKFPKPLPEHSTVYCIQLMSYVSMF